MSTRWRDWLAQARASHWVKNLLVFVPLLTSQQFFNPAAWPGVLLAFAAFCLAASAGYQWNDLADLDADRRHPQKCARPLASGRLSPGTVFALGTALSAGAVALAVAVNLALTLIIAGYIGFSALYSTTLKRLAVIDVLSLAALYCVRIFGGAAAIGVVVSPYLLAFSLFFFLSLALMKRHAALGVYAASDSLPRTPYGKRDSAVLLMTGVAAAIASSALLALYINDASVRSRFSFPHVLWGAWLALLYGVLRGWLAASRGRLDEDLIRAAIRDRSLWLAGAAVVVLFLIAY